MSAVPRTAAPAAAASPAPVPALAKVLLTVVMATDRLRAALWRTCVAYRALKKLRSVPGKIERAVGQALLVVRGRIHSGGRDTRYVLLLHIQQQQMLLLEMTPGQILQAASFKKMLVLLGAREE